MNDKVKELTEKMPEVVKNNKGALIGAAIGYFLFNDSEEMQSAMLGAIAGSLMIDKNKKDDNGEKAV